MSGKEKWCREREMSSRICIISKLKRIDKDGDGGCRRMKKGRWQRVTEGKKEWQGRETRGQQRVRKVTRTGGWKAWEKAGHGEVSVWDGWRWDVQLYQGNEE